MMESNRLIVLSHCLCAPLRADTREGETRQSSETITQGSQLSGVRHGSQARVPGVRLDAPVEVDALAQDSHLDLSPPGGVFDVGGRVGCRAGR